MNKIDLIQQISAKANWHHQIPLYTFFNEFSVDSLEIINGFKGYKFTSFINLMSQDVIFLYDREYKYYEDVQQMDFEEQDLLVKLFSQCYIDSGTNQNTSNDKEIFKCFNGCFNYDMFNLDKESINKLMDLFNNVKFLNSDKKPTKKDYEELEELLAFISAILESNNNIDEVQLNILIQEWEKLPVRHIKYNFIHLISNENFTITNGDDVYLMRKIIFQESKNACIDLECKIFNHKSFKELPFEQKNSIINDLISCKSASAKQNYAEKVISEIYKENAEKSAEEEETIKSVIKFNESITLGELLDNIALNISSTHDTSYIDNSVALGYKEMDNKDIEDIINNFRDDNGNVDLEHPIYYVTKSKVKTKKKN